MGEKQPQTARDRAQSAAPVWGGCVSVCGSHGKTPVCPPARSTATSSLPWAGDCKYYIVTKIRGTNNMADAGPCRTSLFALLLCSRLVNHDPKTVTALRLWLHVFHCLQDTLTRSEDIYSFCGFSPTKCCNHANCQAESSLKITLKEDEFRLIFCCICRFAAVSDFTAYCCTC